MNDQYLRMIHETEQLRAVLADTLEIPYAAETLAMRCESLFNEARADGRPIDRLIYLMAAIALTSELGAMARKEDEDED